MLILHVCNSISSPACSSHNSRVLLHEHSAYWSDDDASHIRLRKEGSRPKVAACGFRGASASLPIDTELAEVIGTRRLHRAVLHVEEGVRCCRCNRLDPRRRQYRQNAARRRAVAQLTPAVPAHRVGASILVQEHRMRRACRDTLDIRAHQNQAMSILMRSIAKLPMCVGSCGKHFSIPGQQQAVCRTDHHIINAADTRHQHKRTPVCQGAVTQLPEVVGAFSQHLILLCQCPTVRIPSSNTWACWHANRRRGCSG
mmetsp:Transcript_58796/g.158438  ORF Transcript_58796/g.158438 Transcript_58796/m.158438 type:complete len:256 (+) Transcript_58796:1-768(+)